jgi:hypothetical protein
LASRVLIPLMLKVAIFTGQQRAQPLGVAAGLTGFSLAQRRQTRLHRAATGSAA